MRALLPLAFLSTCLWACANPITATRQTFTALADAGRGATLILDDADANTIGKMKAGAQACPDAACKAKVGADLDAYLLRYTAARKALAGLRGALAVGEVALSVAELAKAGKATVVSIGLAVYAPARDLLRALQALGIAPDSLGKLLEAL